MITKITGKLLAVADEAATLEVDAFEYEVLIPDFNRRQLQSKLGQSISLHTLHYVEGNPAHGRMTPRIIGFLREADAGMPVKDLCRKHGFSEASYYLWRSKFGGMDVSDARRLKALEAENAKLKKLLAETMLENEVAREALRKKW